MASAASTRPNLSAVEAGFTKLERQRELISNCTALWKELSEHYSSFERSLKLRNSVSFSSIIERSLPSSILIYEFKVHVVKALDVYNAIHDGIKRVRQWQKHNEIVLIFLDTCNKPISEGQRYCAKKALAGLIVLMLDKKDVVSILVQRNHSFGHNSLSSGKDHHHTGGYFWSLSWSVFKSW
ncbi:uncharacterized protein LOC110030370 [Phalaenopsis equestris]|uniref:uncharacterized protein LOC110030370 n=1 Tax=Phalaenopsis equestris TaxID=78828 RepID=UPI0009E562E2|nr:uncharacterized protein LOC110030370 [Phalaenopsis equestris]